MRHAAAEFAEFAETRDQRPGRPALAAIAPLSAARAPVFRDRQRVLRANHTLEHGSLFLMDRATQLSWEHAVPRDPRAGRRISLTFRRFAATH